MIGKIIVLKETLYLYPKGTKFKIVGVDDIRGWDIEVEKGNKISECRFIQHKFEFIDEVRDSKINKILRDEKEV